MWGLSIKACFENLIFPAVAVLVVMSAGVASAKINECQPDGMSDVEAARIIAIATEQGKAFRAAIDAIRASGISYETDTTYDDLMADPERAVALAKERYWLQIYRLYPTQSERGDNMDIVILEHLSDLVNVRSTNYYTMELYDYLRGLASNVGGNLRSSPSWIHVDADVFVFALSQFSYSAGLHYIGGEISQKLKYGIVKASYQFDDTDHQLPTEKPFEILLTVSSNNDGDGIVIEEIQYGHPKGDGGATSSSLTQYSRCLETIKLME